MKFLPEITEGYMIVKIEPSEEIYKKRNVTQIF